ncbi:MAG: 4Fe-4S dicluster domain-containing protein [Ignavibacteria bacterium]|nr:4Fe-4S dicluster domain-containing protein [Ignavibacteria bacterium]MBT8381711.1 4Fe-4S dicluster domain-containing protein [Ignavibacteria bacterium]MBT8392835.1 4Fe-4S dicluster domain-containing protein [Ignavibacteria bacterium]NNJ52134.1 4Fe-4S dicluster domain-containing protein [Ignavibacteriaceae bacterium]NNL20220.1 4Fe-4S dicluster domain-containing protein [Ignavibacteriaceae bacterium]
MGEKSRRNFLKTLGIAGAACTGIPSQKLISKTQPQLSEDRMGVLVDTTVCIGCRRCEWVCKKTHDIPAGEIESYSEESVFSKMRRPGNEGYTKVNRYDNYQNPSRPINVKVQCMHCDQPACVSACIVGAFSKKEDGSVVWDSNKCIGCRYCMVACPFQIPTFEYENALNPDIHKCDFCAERTEEGLLPACVDICPVEALTYGKRRDLIEVAEKRIKLYPDRYIDKIYGFTEVGGTSWMYLANTEFEKLDFPNLRDNPAPGVSESIQHGIFAYFVPPISLYALLGGIMWVTKKKNNNNGWNK